MVSLIEPPEPTLVAPPLLTDLERLTDGELDALPFGVICLDGTGVVQRYNLAEARLARLDRTQVLGRQFFGVVAPCTRTKEFEGRVRAFMRPGRVEPTERFSYFFDFQFGGQEVEVEIIRPTTPGYVYLVVNRRRFTAPREGLPPGFAAPQQEDLAPDERELGVLRDVEQRRIIHVGGPLLEAMRQTWERIAPRGWPLFSAEWGHAWGRLVVVDMEVAALEETDQTLRALPMAQVVERLSAWMRRHGWGYLACDFTRARDGAFFVELQRNALSESVGASPDAQCYLISGLLRAFFTHVAQRLLVVKEIRCTAQGHPSCLFACAAMERKGALEAAVAEGGSDPAAVVRALRGNRG